jgi:hypothetical protein
MRIDLDERPALGFGDCDRIPGGMKIQPEIVTQPARTRHTWRMSAGVPGAVCSRNLIV